MVRRFGVATGWLAALGLAGFALVRVTGVGLGHPFAQLLAFVPYLGAAAVLVLGVLLGARQRWPAVVALAAVLLFAAALLPRGFGGPATGDGPTLTVMSMNMWGGDADPAQIVGLVRAGHVDVLAVQEFTPAARQALASAGLADLLPYQELHPAEGAGGSGLYARHPLADGAVSANPGGFLQASARIAVPGAAPVRVVSVHPVPPSSAERVPLWAQGLRAQPPAGTEPIVLAGDFNATLDHPELRGLIATGYTDAAAALGLGFVTTWPYAGNHVGITPPVTIDHVLAGPGIGVRSYGATKVAIADHKAITATLTLPRR